MLGVDDFHIVRSLDVCGGDRALAFLAQDQRDFFAVVQPESDALEVQHHADHVLLDAVNGGVLVQDAGNRHFSRRIPNHRRQQDTAQRIAQRVPVATFEGLQSNLGAVTAERFDVDRLGFEQIRLHGLFLSIHRGHHRQLRGQPGGVCPRAGMQPRQPCGRLRRLAWLTNDQREYNSTISDSLMSLPNSSRSGVFLKRPSSLLAST